MAHRAPLLRDAVALFAEHRAGPEEDEITVFAHDAVDLLGRTAAEECTDILCAKPSAAHATELQAQVAALKSKLANPTEELSDTLALASNLTGQSARLTPRNRRRGPFY